VTLEVLDAAGATLQTFSSQPAAAAAPGAPAGGRGGRAGGIPNTSPLWRPTPGGFQATAGMHRVAWVPVAGGGGGRGRGGRGGAAALLTGTFTAKFSVNGKSYTQTFNVKPDPRST
jgi:hypothetical protein